MKFSWWYLYSWCSCVSDILNSIFFLSDLNFCDAQGRNPRAFVHAKQAVQHREISATFVFCGQSHYATQTNLELGIFSYSSLQRAGITNLCHLLWHKIIFKVIWNIEPWYILKMLLWIFCVILLNFVEHLTGKQISRL